jgi:hypothetical protein
MLPAKGLMIANNFAKKLLATLPMSVFAVGKCFRGMSFLKKKGKKQLMPQ